MYTALHGVLNRYLELDSKVAAGNLLHLQFFFIPLFSPNSNSVTLFPLYFNATSRSTSSRFYQLYCLPLAVHLLLPVLLVVILLHCQFIDHLIQIFAARHLKSKLRLVHNRPKCNRYFVLHVTQASFILLVAVQLYDKPDIYPYTRYLNKILNYKCLLVYLSVIAAA